MGYLQNDLWASVDKNYNCSQNPLGATDIESGLPQCSQNMSRFACRWHECISMQDENPPQVRVYYRAIYVMTSELNEIGNHRNRAACTSPPPGRCSWMLTGKAFRVPTSHNMFRPVNFKCISSFLLEQAAIFFGGLTTNDECKDMKRG